MKKLLFLSLSLFFCLVLLSGCGDAPLKFRNLLEADQYLKNNIESINWVEFEQLLSSSNKVTKSDFQFLRDTLSKGQRSSHMVVGNKLYRFNQDKQLIYVTEWDESEDSGVLYLKSIHFNPNKTN